MFEIRLSCGDVHVPQWKFDFSYCIPHCLLDARTGWVRKLLPFVLLQARLTAALPPLPLRLPELVFRHSRDEYHYKQCEHDEPTPLLISAHWPHGCRGQCPAPNPATCHPPSHRHHEHGRAGIEDARPKPAHRQTHRQEWRFREAAHARHHDQHLSEVGASLLIYGVLVRLVRQWVFFSDSETFPTYSPYDQQQVERLVIIYKSLQVLLIIFEN